MKSRLACFIAGFLALLVIRAPASVLYVDLNSPNPVWPYVGWSTAATNIQDAIDASSDGDQIWVSNGIYQTGGRIMAGDLNNRVAVNKAVTVQSVNGPWATVIQGAGATNGTMAVRCAWLTNNASLIGFTLKWGATRKSGDFATLASGGGAWCASSNALVANCVIISNTAFNRGGGAYQGTLNNCYFSGNNAPITGCAAYGANLNSCTVVSNNNQSFAAVVASVLTNCVVYYNQGGNSSSSTFSYCCTTPATSGAGNFTSVPELFTDGVHLTSTSPCIGAGINVVSGTDIFGKAWANPPSVGCAEFDPSPLVTKPQLQLTSDPVGFTASAAVSAQSPFLCWWLKDGIPLQDNVHFSFTQTNNLVATGVNFADGGGYQLVVSNAFGVVTSAVAQLVIHCVDVAGTNPVTPFLAWGTAATNIQDAIMAATAGDVVLVTNGLYATGGKSMDGVITNRVSVDKAILVQSVNGPNVTTIQGAWDPTSTNGPGALRCAWLTNGAVLGGFTLTSGATRAINAFSSPQQVGGGVLGVSNSTVANCTIKFNAAASEGGGASGSALINCLLLNNSVLGVPGYSVDAIGGGASRCNLKNCIIAGNYALSEGGGTAYSQLKNCAVNRNSAGQYSGGAYYGTLVNCTVIGNSVVSYYNYGGGVSFASLTNCIVYANRESSIPNTTSNYYGCTFSYSCSSPLPPGVGNVNFDPQVVADGFHLTATSPCIGAGTAGVFSVTDIDGQPWNNPPSIGCDEWQPAPVIGRQPSYQVGFPAHGLTFNLVIAGQTPFNCLWSKDGASIQDDTHHSNSGTANLAVNYFGPDDAGVYQVVVSNAFGIVTSQVAQVVIHAVDAAGSNPVAPYSAWATAATNIQDAIDSAVAGDIVLVTNGIYATGGKVMAGDLTNRVALNKPVTVLSVNGYATTVIQGAWDPAATNGPGAVRCAYLGDGAVLSGFTLQHGATRATGDSYSGGPLESGGAIWCVSTSSVVANCFVTNNVAIYGGGIAYGTLNNSLMMYNVGTRGGGTYYATLNNCTVEQNSTLAPFFDPLSDRGAGTYGCVVHNSIVLYNHDNWPINEPTDNYGPSLANYFFSSTTSSSGTLGGLPDSGNINGNSANPQFLDSYHIAFTSPCCGTGSALYASGTDLDGEPWGNPPSMGCDEVIASNIIGPLSVGIIANQTNLLVSPPGTFRPAIFTGITTGRVSRVEWSFGDGPTITNLGVGVNHQWTNAGNYTVAFTAYNTDDPAGVSANIVVNVQPLNAPQLQSPARVNNGFEFQFVAQTNANYTVQYSTNLALPSAWQTLRTITFSSGGVIQISDPAWTNMARFYRVLAQ